MAQEVETYMKNLEHPLKAEISAIRAQILASDAMITERIKWNAPSFCYKGEDRVTFKLNHKDRIQLVFHRGAKVKDSSDFVFNDSSGLLEWAAVDRAVVTLRGAEDLNAKEAALIQVVLEWMRATS